MGLIGYTCGHEDVDKQRPGCCLMEGKEERMRFSCQSCDETTSCCDRFEYCVSCCMHPSRVRG